MSTAVLGLKNDYGDLDTLPKEWLNGVADDVESAMVDLSEVLGIGCFKPGDFTVTLIPGSLALQVSAGKAVVGDAGARRLVRITSPVTVTAGTSGLTASATNYLYLKKNPTSSTDPATSFTSNTTGAAPADSILVATAVAGATDFTSANSSPAGRINLQNPIVLSGPAANRPPAGTAGRLYFSTDSRALEYDTGAAWQGIGYLPAGGGTLSGNLTVSGALTLGALAGVLKAAAGAVSGGATTTDLPEGSNPYFTNARARGAVSAAAPLVYDSSTGQFSLPGASGSQNGYLSSADWTTFNNKVAKAGDTMSGLLTITVSGSSSGLIVNNSFNNGYAAQLNQTHATASNGLKIQVQTVNAGDAALQVFSDNGNRVIFSMRNNGLTALGASFTPTVAWHQLGGQMRLQSLATPGAPTVTPQGTGGSSAATYYVVAVDRAGKRTMVSAAGTTATGNATLDATNFNRITWAAVAGAVSYDILKGATNAKLGAASAPTTTFDDTGGATSAYTAPTRNDTADVVVDGQVTTGSLSLSDGGNVTLGTGTGTQIGTATTQKLGFYGAAPIVRPAGGAATASATYGSNEQGMVQRVYDAVRNLGLMA
jgi:hypothetical protein